jgi:hypothetical protein
MEKDEIEIIKEDIVQYPDENIKYIYFCINKGMMQCKTEIVKNIKKEVQ